MKPTRSGCALAVFATAVLWLLGPGTPTAIAAIGGADFPAALLGIAWVSQVALSAWVVLVVVLGTVFGPTAVLRAVTPQLLRHALFLGAAGGLVLSPAHADTPPGSGSDLPSFAVASRTLAGLQLPDRPVVEAAQASIVVVRPGDTLWAIAARALPAGATPTQIARSTAEWHAHNHDVIGSDPNLILPMQRLIQPGSSPS